MTKPAITMASAVQEVIDTVGPKLVIGTPLGIGKPNLLLNAFYERALDDSSISVEICTALSLAPPVGKSLLESRFIDPFSRRYFGEDYPRLRYLDDLNAGRLPKNVRIVEFYLRSGALLNNAHSQSNYISSNYTHAARDMLDRGVNVVLQAIPPPREIDGNLTYSLGLNPDITLELREKLRESDQPHLFVAQILEQLPFTAGHALIKPGFFNRIVAERATHKPFATPRGAISDADFAIGLNASTLIPDAGTLQLGIGSLGDAVTYACLLRHQRNAVYRATLQQLGTLPRSADLIDEIGGLAPFQVGLHGCSEMITDGFMHLFRAGILSFAPGAGNTSSPNDKEGIIMRAAFALGSHEFYAFLRSLDLETLRQFDMAGVAQINQLYGGNEAREKALRPKARFINASMKSTALGAAVSDALEDERVVSGVGGQYNFVAMAHAMEDGRSVLMLRSFRGTGKSFQPNIVWQYGHTTIPRHLRDIVISEYGIADLRGKTDAECARAMIAISDSRTHTELIRAAVKAGKLPADFKAPESWALNTPAHIKSSFQEAKEQGHFAAYPFGCDFDETELRLAGALQRLKRSTTTTGGKLKAIVRALVPLDAKKYRSELERMDLTSARDIQDRLARRLLLAALDNRI